MGARATATAAARVARPQARRRRLAWTGGAANTIPGVQPGASATDARTRSRLPAWAAMARPAPHAMSCPERRAAAASAGSARSQGRMATSPTAAPPRASAWPLSPSARRNTKARAVTRAEYPMRARVRHARGVYSTNDRHGARLSPHALPPSALRRRFRRRRGLAVSGPARDPILLVSDLAGPAGGAGAGLAAGGRPARRPHAGRRAAARAPVRPLRDPHEHAVLRRRRPGGGGPQGGESPAHGRHGGGRGGGGARAVAAGERGARLRGA